MSFVVTIHTTSTCTCNLHVGGTNPLNFAKEKYLYSMCPVLLVPLNLPQSLRSSVRSILLTGIIPGPAEVKNTDPYVDVLVDEILKLQNTRVRCTTRRRI